MIKYYILLFFIFFLSSCTVVEPENNIRNDDRIPTIEEYEEAIRAPIPQEEKGENKEDDFSELD